MNTLPQEILNEILDYLSLSERLEKRIVCKRFRDIIVPLSLDKKNLYLLRECLFELGAIVNLQYMLKKHIHLHQSFILECISNISGIVFHKVKFEIYRAQMDMNQDVHTIIRREILVDSQNRFTEYDDIDGTNYYDGMKKLLCNIRDFFIISNNSNVIIHHNYTPFDWKEEVKKLFDTPLEKTIHVMQANEKILDISDYNYIHNLFQKNSKIIFDILGDQLERIAQRVERRKRREYIDFLFSVLFNE